MVKKIFFIIFGFISAINSSLDFDPNTIKESFIGGPLSPLFLKKLQDTFNVYMFIESGTLFGATTNNACSIFNQIHTVELSSFLYSYNFERFKNNKNVYVYNGDSGIIFRDILQSVPERAIFWLDGHYSEGYTAKGELNTPIMQELEAIGQHKIKDHIILIDDIRLFDNGNKKIIGTSLEGYPTLSIIIDKILSINKSYKFIVIGDLLMAYQTDNNIKFNQFLEALTISRLSEDLNYDAKLVIENEILISKAEGANFQLIENLNNSFSSGVKEFGLGKHYMLWNGLANFHKGNYSKAYELLKDTLDLFKHWRISWYLAQTAAKLDLKDEENRYLTMVRGACGKETDYNELLQLKL